MTPSDSQLKPSNGSADSVSSPSPSTEIKPRPRTLSLEPEYAIEAGVAHEFNGTLYVPTQSEQERIERLNAIKDGVRQIPALVAFNEPPRIQRAVPYSHGYVNEGKPPCVKMSARSLIRLGATKSKGH
jgi:hypothetical protein